MTHNSFEGSASFLSDFWNMRRIDAEHDFAIHIVIKRQFELQLFV